MSTAPVNALDFGQFAQLRASARADEAGAVRKAAQQFEGLFTQMLLKSMRAGLPGDSTMGSQGEFYQGMFDQQLSQSLSAGKGLGLADMLVRQLTQGQGAAEAGDGSLGVEFPLALQSGSRARPAPAGDAGATGVDGAWRPKSADEFIDAIRPHAEKAARELGVPARAIIAQAAIETGWGKHMPRHADGRTSFNLFGIKAHGWDGETLSKRTQEFRNGSYGSEQAKFRSYDSLESAFGDYVSFLKENPRYVNALRADDVQGFAKGLQKAGYATDPAYAQKLVKVAYGRSMNTAYAEQAGHAYERARLQSV